MYPGKKSALPSQKKKSPRQRHQGGARTPNDRASKAVEEEALATETATVTDTSIVLRVEGVEKRAGDKIGGPDCGGERWELDEIVEEFSEADYSLMEGGWTRKRRAIPPIENPMS